MTDIEKDQVKQAIAVCLDILTTMAHKIAGDLIGYPDNPSKHQRERFANWLVNKRGLPRKTARALANRDWAYHRCQWNRKDLP